MPRLFATFAAPALVASALHLLFGLMRMHIWAPPLQQVISWGSPKFGHLGRPAIAPCAPGESGIDPVLRAPHRSAPATPTRPCPPCVLQAVGPGTTSGPVLQVCVGTGVGSMHDSGCSSMPVRTIFTKRPRLHLTVLVRCVLASPSWPPGGVMPWR